MKIVAVAMCIVAIAIGMATMDDLHVAELNPRPVECCERVTPPKGFGFQGLIDAGSSLKSHRKHRRLLTVERPQGRALKMR